ncbi:MAG: cadherin-like domain-containing protein [Acidimicrobiia bacterium]|nr:cadherin-like domain-containing protein [Acidimicrobiia bacterium]
MISGEGTYEVDPVTGEVTFTPEDGFVGESTVDYVVSDDDGNVSEATITVTVQARKFRRLRLMMTLSPSRVCRSGSMWLVTTATATV